MKSACFASGQALCRREGWKEVCHFHCQILHHTGCGRDQLFYQGKLEEQEISLPCYYLHIVLMIPAESVAKHLISSSSGGCRGWIRSSEGSQVTPSHWRKTTAARDSDLKMSTGSYYILLNTLNKQCIFSISVSFPLLNTCTQTTVPYCI